jgi:hypothetical protein
MLAATRYAAQKGCLPQPRVSSESWPLSRESGAVIRRLASRIFPFVRIGSTQPSRGYFDVLARKYFSPAMPIVCNSAVKRTPATAALSKKWYHRIWRREYTTEVCTLPRHFLVDFDFSFQIVVFVC